MAPIQSNHLGIMLHKLIFVTLLSSKRTFIKTMIILGVVCGYLYAVTIAPVANKYFYTDPIYSSSLDYYVYMIYDPNKTSDLSLLAKYSGHINSILCGDVMPMVANDFLALEFFDEIVMFKGDILEDVSLAYASSVDALRINFPDVDNFVLSKADSGASLDGVIILGLGPTKYSYSGLDDMIGETVEMDVTFYNNLTSSFKFLVVGYSRFATFGGKINLVLFNDSVLAMMGPIDTFYIDSGLDPSSLSNLIDMYISGGKSSELSDLITDVHIVSRDVILTNEEQEYSRELGRWIPLYTTLALIISIVVSLKDAGELAKSLSEIIGIIRLYGGSIRKIILIGFISSVVVGVSAILGMLIYVYLIFYIVNAVMPPLTYILVNNWQIPLITFTTLIIGTSVIFVYYASQRSLESYVYGGR